MSKCEWCNQQEANIIMTYEDENEQLCLNCYNKQMEDELHVNLAPHPDSFSVKDANGKSRVFYVNARLDPVGIFMEAGEKVEYGYLFEVHGELDCDQAELYTKLVDKVKRGIATTYVVDHRFPNGQLIKSIKEDQVVGRVEWDPSNQDCPLVVIDGKPYTWEQLGQMVKSFEGFQIQLKMFDRTDEVE